MIASSYQARADTSDLTVITGSGWMKQDGVGGSDDYDYERGRGCPGRCCGDVDRNVELKTRTKLGKDDRPANLSATLETAHRWSRRQFSTSEPLLHLRMIHDLPILLSLLDCYRRAVDCIKQSSNKPCAAIASEPSSGVPQLSLF